MNFSRKWTTENWYENIDWMVFLAISLALIALEEARPVLMVQKIEKHDNMCWPHDIVFILYRIYFLYILLLKPSYMYKHITLNICCLQIIPFIIRNIVYDEIKTECLFYYIFVCLNTTNRFRVVRSNKLKWHTVVAQAGFESLKKLNENRINISIFNI